MAEEVVLVAGGSGMIGSHIVDEVVKRGDRVVVLDPAPPWHVKEHVISGKVIYKHGATFDTPQMNRIRRNFKIKEIYDLGALLGTEELMPRINSAISFVTLGAANTVELALETKAMVFYVLTEFYGDDYADFTDGYTVSKNAAHSIIREYQKVHGIDAVLAKVHHAFSTRQQLIAQRKLLPTLIAYGLVGESMKLFGDVNRRLDFVYAGDVARIAVDLIRNPATKRGHIYDIGGPEENFWSLLETAEKVNKATGMKSKIQAMEDIRKQPIVSNKSKDDWRDVIGDGTRTSLDLYLPEMVDGFRKRFTMDDLRMAVKYFEGRFNWGV